MLSGKVAVISGASLPNGIGQACALALAKNGARVVVTDLVRSEDKQAESTIEAVVNEARGIGAEAIGLAVDVSDPAQIESCVEQVMRHFGRIDILINNAGVPDGVGPFLDMPLAAWQRTLDVNVMGVVHFCRAVIPVMLEQGAGVIINNSSLAGLRSDAFYSAYSTSKHAVMGLTKVLAAEFGQHNIRVNAICPGFIDTGMMGLQNKMLSENHGMTPEETEQYMKNLPALKRFAGADEVADVVVFLSSDAARYVSGIGLPVTGGLPGGL